MPLYARAAFAARVLLVTRARALIAAARLPCAERTAFVHKPAAVYYECHQEAAVEQVVTETENTAVLEVASATTGSVLNSSEAVVIVAAVAALAA